MSACEPVTILLATLIVLSLCACAVLIVACAVSVVRDVWDDLR